MKNIHKLVPAVVAAFALGSNAVLANNLSTKAADKIAKKCDEAAADVNVQWRFGQRQVLGHGGAR